MLNPLQEQIWIAISEECPELEKACVRHANAITFKIMEADGDFDMPMVLMHAYNEAVAALSIDPHMHFSETATVFEIGLSHYINETHDTSPYNWIWWSAYAEFQARQVTLTMANLNQQES